MSLLRELSNEAWQALRGDDVPSDNAVDVDVDEELADEQESDHQE